MKLDLERMFPRRTAPAKAKRRQAARAAVALPVPVAAAVADWTTFEARITELEAFADAATRRILGLEQCTTARSAVAGSMNLKRCARCKTTRPFNAFSKSAKAKDGLHAWCRVCRAEYARMRHGAKAGLEVNPAKPVVAAEREIVERGSGLALGFAIVERADDANAVEGGGCLTRPSSLVLAVPATLKVCSVCGDEKPVADFPLKGAKSFTRADDPAAPRKRRCRACGEIAQLARTTERNAVAKAERDAGKEPKGTRLHEQSARRGEIVRIAKAKRGGGHLRRELRRCLHPREIEKGAPVVCGGQVWTGGEVKHLADVHRIGLTADEAEKYFEEPREEDPDGGGNGK